MTVTDFLFDFCTMSALLVLAKLLRLKVKLFQRFYIPAPLIAGFLGLFLGKQFLNVLPFSSSIGDYAGVLIAVVFGTMFLGDRRKVTLKTMIDSAGDSFFVNGAAEIAQFGLFMVLGAFVLPVVFPGINDAFGLMVPAGFAGGHGTAAAMGGVFAERGWEDAASIGQTFATIGLLGGIVLGVLVLNIGVRNGQTRVLKKIEELPEEMRTGLNPVDSGETVGRNTINSISMDTLTWHASLVLLTAGMAYVVNAGLKAVLPQVAFPTYGIAIICGIFVQAVLRALKLDGHTDKQVISHIGSCTTDYLVAFGVAPSPSRSSSSSRSPSSCSPSWRSRACSFGTSSSAAAFLGTVGSSAASSSSASARASSPPAFCCCASRTPSRGRVRSATSAWCGSSSRLSTRCSSPLPRRSPLPA